MVLIAEGVTRLDLFETNGSADVTGFDEVDGILLIGVHLHDAADALVLTTAHILNIGTGIELTTVTAEEGEATYEWIGHDLEGECSERFLRIRLAGDLLTGIRVCSFDGLDVEWTGQVADNTVQHGLHTFVLER